MKRGVNSQVKIVQVLTSLREGDAIGNDVVAMDEVLRKAGYSCEMMAVTIGDSLLQRATNVDFTRIRKEDLVIFHKATGDALTKHVAGLACKKLLIYHNITPAKFLLPYDPVAAWNLMRGRRQLKQLAHAVDYACGDSDYNSGELRDAGMAPDRVSTLPILFDINSPAASPDPDIVKRLQAEKGTKMLFIGRIAPNKKQEDIIKVYYHYLLTEDPEAKLYLVGGWSGFEKYFAKLKGFSADLGLREDQVVFTGHISEEEKEAYLTQADVLVCMSEHEGFCVPLLEAMRHELPIAAYAAAAVPETLGKGGMLFDRKDYRKIAREIGKMLKDDKERNRIIENQRMALHRFDLANTEKKLLSLIDRITKEGSA